MSTLLLLILVNLSKSDLNLFVTADADHDYFNRKRTVTGSKVLCWKSIISWKKY